MKQVPPGLDLQVGRMGYTSGAEAATGDARIESLKRQRLDARIVGEFEWSIYQRGFDGVRADWTRGPVRPPAWRSGRRRAALPAWPARPSTTSPSMAAPSAFSRRRGCRTRSCRDSSLQYDDDRRVTQRPDNTGLGGHARRRRHHQRRRHARRRLSRGRFVDVLAWGVVQRGDWYGQAHRAGTVAFEGGYQWARAPWSPWLRAGLLHAQRRRRAGRRRHGTYFPVLPTVRRFSQTTVFSTMNVDDAFVQVMARPPRRVGLRLDVHALHLASAADLWYIGSGATLEEGAAFGYSGRRSNGSRELGTSTEGSADVAVTPIWSVNAFVGHVNGGRVVTGTFRDDQPLVPLRRAGPARRRPGPKTVGTCLHDYACAIQRVREDKQRLAQRTECRERQSLLTGRRSGRCWSRECME